MLCDLGNGACCKSTIEGIQRHIASLRAELEAFNTPKNSSFPQQQQQQQQQQGAGASVPLCLCGVTNLQEENVRLRLGLVAKHNEIVHLRGLMMNPDNFGCKHSDRAALSPLAGTMGAEGRLPAGGVCPGGYDSGPMYGGGGRNGPRYSAPTGGPQGSQLCPAAAAAAAAAAATRLEGGYGAGGSGMTGDTCGETGPCHMPGCPHGQRVANQGYCTGAHSAAQNSYMVSAAYCNSSQSATAIIEESRRQMEQTENEIKYKLQEIKDKKNQLEEDIANLQKVLLVKQQEATSNMQAARTARANEIAQAAHMATELQKQQRAQAQEAARAAMELQQAQDEQSRKQAMAARAAEQAQQAQYHQLAMTSQAAAAAERAEEAQREQAVQADEAARAAEAVRTAQEEQNRVATRQLQEAETLKRNQEEQACKTAQATEALHAAHVAQVAQQAQACQATTQAHTVLTQHKYIPPAMGCEEIDQGMRLNMTGPMAAGGGAGGGGRGKCCNPNCPNNK